METDKEQLSASSPPSSSPLHGSEELKHGRPHTPTTSPFPLPTTQSRTTLIGNIYVYKDAKRFHPHNQHLIPRQGHGQGMASETRPLSLLFHLLSLVTARPCLLRLGQGKATTRLPLGEFMSAPLFSLTQYKERSLRAKIYIKKPINHCTNEERKTITP